MKKLLLLSISFLILSACVPRRYSYDAYPGGSSVSDVQINVPRKTQLHPIFGVNCRDFNASVELLTRLGTQDKCEAIDKLLDGFRLTLKMEECEAGITAQSTELIGLVSRIKPKDKVTKGCTYSVSLELGEIDQSKVYFSNTITSTRNLIVKKDAPGLISLKVEMHPTAAGVALGFPATGSLQTDGQAADLSIDVSFGKKQQ